MATGSSSAPPGALRPTFRSAQSTAPGTNRMVFYGPSSAIGMSHRILVVDDHEPYRRFMSTSLARRAETETFEVSDGVAALEKAEALRPDVILLALGLPGLGGLDVARQLPRISPRSKVLVVSHELDAGIISEALRLGPLGYLHTLRRG